MSANINPQIDASSIKETIVSRGYHHFELGASHPDQWESADYLEFQIQLPSKGGTFLQFGLNGPPGNIGGKPNPATTRKSPHMNILIYDPSVIKLTLPAGPWYWANDFPAITTTRNDVSDLYFELMYLVNGQWKDEASTVGKRTDCKEIQFGVALSDDPQKTYCGINFNVDLIQNNGYILPIVIDPDIRNPGVSLYP